jgi:hypothetical protein
MTWPLHATRGAVMVEFLIAFMPLFIAFECMLQLAGLQVARLVTHHAAVCAARAAAVVLSDDPRRYGGIPVGSFSGRRRADIERAAEMVLTASGNMAGTRVSSEPGRIRVATHYQCALPLARSVVCGGAQVTLVGEAVVPDQRARYPYE